MLSMLYPSQLNRDVTRSISSSKKNFLQSLYRMSSGKRNSSAVYDPSGLSFSIKMDTKYTDAENRIRNFQEAVSMLQTADSSYIQIQDIILRTRSILQQGLQPGLTDSDRSNLQLKLNQYLKEIDSIADNTKYNNKKLLAETSRETNNPIDATSNVVIATDDRDPFPSDGIPDWTKAEEDAFASKVERIVNIAQERVYALTGMANKSTDPIKVILMEEDVLGNPNNYAAANADEIYINSAYFLGNKRADYTIEQVLTHEVDHVLLLRNNPNAGNTIDDVQNFWFIEGAATWVADTGDTRMSLGATPDPVSSWDLKDETLPSIALLKGGNGTWDEVDYSEAFLAFKYIEERYDSSKIKDIFNLVVNNSVDAQTAITTVLPDFNNFNDFEDAVRVWGNSYVAQERYNRISGGGIGQVSMDFLPKQMDEFETNYGAAKFVFNTFNMMLGSLDYLGYINVDTESATKRSLITVKNALNVVTMAQIKTETVINSLGIEINNERKKIENRSAYTNYLSSEDFAKETINYTLEKMRNAKSKDLLKVSNLTAKSVFAKLFAYKNPSLSTDSFFGVDNSDIITASGKLGIKQAIEEAGS